MRKSSVIAPLPFFALLLFTLFTLTTLATLNGPNSAVAASARQELVEDSMINQVMQRKTMRVGFSTFVPWAMKDKNGEFIGFEIDIARRLAADLGVQVEFVPTNWDGIIMGLLSGQFDIIIGGMSVQPARNLKVNFSIPYDYAGMDIVASKSKAAGFNSLEAFNKPDVIIALRTGASSAAAVKKHLPLAQARFFADEAQALQEVKTGRAHAMVSSAPLPAFQALKNPDTLFVPLDAPFTREPIGLAIRKGDPDSLNVLDNWVRMVESEGWLKERREFWFRSLQWEKLQ